MAFDLSSPAAQLAFDVARRNQEVQDMKQRLAEESRARINAKLTPYGNDISQYENIVAGTLGPAEATQQSRAQAMQEYVTGLPELLARAAAERKASSGGGGGGSTNVPAPYQPFDPEAILEYVIAEPKSFYADRTTPAMNEARRRGPRLPRPGAPVTAVPTFRRTGSADRWG